MSQNLPYFLADTLNMTLYQIDGKFKGRKVFTMDMGPWPIDLPVSLESDIISVREISSWVRAGDLPLYLVVKDEESMLFVLNEEALIKLKAEREAFTAKTVEGRLEEIKLAIRDVFQWADGEWTPMEMIEVA